MGSKYIFMDGHPHEFEFATPATEQKMKLIGGVPMHPWKIIDCKHGVEWCYAEIGQVEKIYWEGLDAKC